MADETNKRAGKDRREPLRLNPDAIGNIPPLPLEEVAVVVIRERPWRERAAEHIGLHFAANVMSSLFGSAIVAALIFFGLYNAPPKPPTERPQEIRGCEETPMMHAFDPSWLRLGETDVDQ